MLPSATLFAVSLSSFSASVASSAVSHWFLIGRFAPGPPHCFLWVCLRSTCSDLLGSICRRSPERFVVFQKVPAQSDLCFRSSSSSSPATSSCFPLCCFVSGHSVLFSTGWLAFDVSDLPLHLRSKGHRTYCELVRDRNYSFFTV